MRCHCQLRNTFMGLFDKLTSVYMTNVQKTAMFACSIKHGML